MNHSNTKIQARHFQVDGIDVRYAPSETGMRLECTACQLLPNCEHVMKVRAWITLSNAMIPTDEPDQIQECLVAVLKREPRDPYAQARQALGEQLSETGVIETTEDDPKVAAIADFMQRNIRQTKVSESRQRIAQVIQAVQAENSDHLILSEIDIDGSAEVAAQRMVKLLAAFIRHVVGKGERSDTSIVRVRQKGGEFTIIVSNIGVDDTAEQDSEAPRGEILRSFRPAPEPSRGKSPGPGLDVCSEMARENGGELTVSSEDGLTSLVFRMPIE